ncbi:PIN domain-containing protein [Sphingomonas sp. PP-F2F-A104-K0414]|uniref:PIN domain-containing protein n=1 Tax=Sphingomonas sp. PP-F2F-A104-K0414 TaxID=2135661 RepID=UPI0010447201|nr:PIN domain-containing protein [Sphingomonas sp. PP-F2F-A104-K0414]TCP99583.1 PIN domain-containing protein [Sphingomonas sp. PP-F2F-A104-K0414]
MSDRPPLIIFPDTNVLVQGRALHDLPWSEFGTGPIDLVLCGPVIRELDRLKTRPGRAGKVARAYSTKVRELMSSADKSEVLVESTPRVMLRLSPGKTNLAPQRQGLDVGHDDQAIINQALARLDQGENVVLLTGDNFAALAAEEFGLPVRLMPDHWLKEPEKDDSARELARRDAEIARLKATEPTLEHRFIDADGNEIERLEVTMKRYQPIIPEEVDRLVARVGALAPMAAVTPVAAAKYAKPRATGRGFDLSEISYPSLGMTPVTQADVEKYESDYRDWLSGVRRKIAGFHAEWNRRREWPRAIFCATNTGSRPANDVLVEVEASGDFKLSGYRQDGDDDEGPKRGSWLELSLPPTPPKPMPRSVSMLAHDWLGRDPSLLSRPYFPTMPPRRDDDVFYWREGRSDQTEVLSLECKAWRHGRDEEEFSFRVWASDEGEVRGLITARVNASNLSDAAERRLPLRITFEDRECLTMAESLVDDFAVRLARR